MEGLREARLRRLSGGIVEMGEGRLGVEVISVTSGRGEDGSGVEFKLGEVEELTEKIGFHMGVVDGDLDVRWKMGGIFDSYTGFGHLDV